MAKDPKVEEHVVASIEKHCNAKVARYQTIKRIKGLPVALRGGDRSALRIEGRRGLDIDAPD